MSDCKNQYNILGFVMNNEQKEIEKTMIDNKRNAIWLEYNVSKYEVWTEWVDRMVIAMVPYCNVKTWVIIKINIIDYDVCKNIAVTCDKHWTKEK